MSKFDGHMIRVLAVETGLHPKTVASVLEGGGNLSSQIAVEAAMARKGLTRVDVLCGPKMRAVGAHARVRA